MGNTIKSCLFERNVNPTFRSIVPNHTVDENIKINSKGHPNHAYCSNFIRTTRYTILTFIPKNLFEQFHRFANIYFVFVVALNWIPQVNAFAKEVAALPVLFVLFVTALKDAFEDIRRYRSDKQINHRKCRVFSVKDSRYVKKEWSSIHPGDFVYLSCNEVIPADILFIRSSDIQGICHIESSNLDGESNLKQRQIVEGFASVSESKDFVPSMFKYTVKIEQPNAEIYSFKGFIDMDEGKVSLNSSNLLLRGCKIKNTDFIEGIVVYAGPETKAMVNNRGPRYKISKLESKINRDVVWCVILLLFMCFFCAIGSGIWLADYNNLTDNTNLVPFIAFGDLEQYSPLYQGFLVFWTYIIIFQSVIPLPLYVSLELVKLGQIYFIIQDVKMYDEETDKGMECRALNITEDLGQIEYIFSDKTGTLTENIMEFKTCTVGAVNYPHLNDDMGSQSDSMLSITGLSRTSSILENLVLEPALQRELSNMCLRSLDSAELTIPVHVRHVQEFFLLMAVCNTVVVSFHEDAMDDSGVVPDSYFTKQMQRAKSPSKEVVNKNSINRIHAGTPTSFKSLLSLSVSENGDLASEGSVASSSFLSDSSNTMHYEAESPDELALVKAANTYGCKLVKRSPGKVKVLFPGEREPIEFEVLNILHFDPIRKRMSVIVRHPLTRNITLYVKGADSCIFSVLSKKYETDTDAQRELDSTKSLLESYAKRGLRTLCMAKRVLSEAEYKHWAANHKRAETDMEDREKLVMDSCCAIEIDLELLGATGIEDKLQEGVPSTISKLRSAGVKVWVLTGDKQETAIQIAYACRLFSEEQRLLIINASSQEQCKTELEKAIDELRRDQQQLTGQASRIGSQASLFSRSLVSLQSSGTDRLSKYALVIDGPTLSFATSEALERDFLKICLRCESVVCCRATPIQKATVVKLIRDKVKKMTLAIGDGANDVSMIQTADIGIGISGQEGMQAVMASDFSISKFRFLERLLLVHGHWNHARLAKFAAIMFYKSLLSVLVLFWFQIFSGFSGSLMIDSLYLTMQHVIFTAAPPLANGIFDKDVSAETLLLDPSLYKPGQRGELYTHRTFLIVTIDSVYQSLVIYFLPHLAYKNHNIGLWEFGTTCDVCMILSILLQFCIETSSWVWIQWFAIVLSFLLFWSFLLISNAVFFTFDHPSNPYWVMENTIATATHSAIVILACFISLLPRLIIRSVQITIFPDEIGIAKRREKYREQELLRQENENNGQDGENSETPTTQATNGGYSSMGENSSSTTLSYVGGRGGVDSPHSLDTKSHQKFEGSTRSYNKRFEKDTAFQGEWQSLDKKSNPRMRLKSHTTTGTEESVIT